MSNYPYLTDLRDQTLLSHMPTLMKPRFGELPKLETGTSRLIMAKNGVYIEAVTHALHIVLPIMSSPYLLPYGEQSAFVHLIGGNIPSAIIETIYRQAVTHCPNEYVAKILYHPDKGYRLHEPEIVSQSGGHVSYKNTQYDENEVCIDLHTHGAMNAFFSLQDDEDDIQGIHLSMVLGNCGDINTLERRSRACIFGKYIDVDMYLNNLADEHKQVTKYG